MSTPPHPHRPLTLLGGLTPAQFMRRHWQKRPLLIRAALPNFVPILSRAHLFALARSADVESRLVVRTERGRWTLAHGPFARAALPAPTRPRWTLLVQGVELHDERARELLAAFRFVPDARLDDLMISWASDRGGVGPHVDDYDVFLLQARGRRRWRIARRFDPSLRADAPLKILRRFSAEREHVLEPGDMLYLPPGWAHDGAAEGGECMTYSIGFRSPHCADLAAELVERLAGGTAAGDGPLYRDPRQPATREPARIPAPLRAFAVAAARRLLARTRELGRALGETLTQPKANVRFDARPRRWRAAAVVLDRRTSMLYDDEHVFINGRSHRATGRDAALFRRLADRRRLDARAVRAASPAATGLLRDWLRAGWLRLDAANGWPRGESGARPRLAAANGPDRPRS
jgi:50S ribosomal protein L16 3-hydroxylase